MISRRHPAPIPRPAPDVGALAHRYRGVALEFVTATAIGIAGAAALAGCGIGSPGGAPADAAPVPIPPAAAPAAPADSTTTTPPPDRPGDVGPGSAPSTRAGDTRVSADLAVVGEALERYDRALSELSQAPEAVDDPADRLLTQWHAITVEGSDLDRDVLARIRGRRDEGIVVGPPASSPLSYVHHARAAARVVPPPGLADPPEELSFTWCGWSPGIGRRIGTDAVVDDVVGSAAGTGIVRRDVDSGVWMVTSLFETSFDALAPGSADPCV